MQNYSTKFLIIIPNYHKYLNGGSEIQGKYLADCLDKLGYRLHYIFLSDHEFSYRDRNITIHGIKKKNDLLVKMFGHIIYYREVLKRIHSIKPDIIYSRNITNLALPIIQYCTNKKCQSIVHLASVDDVKKELKVSKKVISNILELMGRIKIFSKVDKIIAQAKYQDILLRKNFNRGANLIFPNIHPKPKNFVKKEKSNLRVVWIANWKKWKQPEVFFELTKKCQDTGAKFIMIGRIAEEGWASRLKKQIEENLYIENLGELSIEDVNNELNKASIFVNTSLKEGFPNTYIQAWMRKVPVVSLNVDPDDIIKKYKLGYNSGNFSQLVKDVKKLISDEGLRKIMGNRAQEYALKNHSFNHIEKLTNIL